MYFATAEPTVTGAVLYVLPGNPLNTSDSLDNSDFEIAYDQALGMIFRPLNELDRRIRPKYWAIDWSLVTPRGIGSSAQVSEEPSLIESL